MKKLTIKIIAMLQVIIMVILTLPVITAFSRTADELIKTRVQADSGNNMISIVPSDITDPTAELQVLDATFEIERDYNQKASVPVENTSESNLQYYLAVENKYSDIYLNFVKSGSKDAPLTITAGETQNIDMSIFAQNTSRESYDIRITAYIIENGVERLANTGTVTLNVAQSAFDVSITAGSKDQYSLAQTFTIRNNSSISIADLSLTLLDGLVDYARISPGVNNYELKGRQSISVKIVPDLTKFKNSDITTLSGQLKAFSGANSITANVAFDTGGEEIVSTTMRQLALLQDGNPFWDIDIDYSQSPVANGDVAEFFGLFEFSSTNHFTYSNGKKSLDLTTMLTASDESQTLTRGSEKAIPVSQYKQLIQDNVSQEKLSRIIFPDDPVFLDTSIFDGVPDEFDYITGNPPNQAVQEYMASVGFFSNTSFTDEEFIDFFFAVAGLVDNAEGLDLHSMYNVWYNPTKSTSEKLPVIYSMLGKLMLRLNYVTNDAGVALLDVLEGGTAVYDPLAQLKHSHVDVSDMDDTVAGDLPCCDMKSDDMKSDDMGTMGLGTWIKEEYINWFIVGNSKKWISSGGAPDYEFKGYLPARSNGAIIGGTYENAADSTSGSRYCNNQLQINCAYNDVSFESTANFPRNFSDCAISMGLGYLYNKNKSKATNPYSAYGWSEYCLFEALGVGQRFCTGTSSYIDKDTNAVTAKNGHMNCSWFPGIAHSEKMHLHAPIGLEYNMLSVGENTLKYQIDSNYNYWYVKSDDSWIKLTTSGSEINKEGLMVSNGSASGYLTIDLEKLKDSGSRTGKVEVYTGCLNFKPGSGYSNFDIDTSSYDQHLTITVIQGKQTCKNDCGDNCQCYFETRGTTKGHQLRSTASPSTNSAAVYGPLSEGAKRRNNKDDSQSIVQDDLGEQCTNAGQTNADFDNPIEPKKCDCPKDSSRMAESMAGTMAQTPGSQLFITSRMFDGSPYAGNAGWANEEMGGWQFQHNLPVTYDYYLNGQKVGTSKTVGLTEVDMVELPTDNLKEGKNSILKRYNTNAGHYKVSADTQITLIVPPNSPVSYIGNPATLENVRSLPDFAVYSENIIIENKTGIIGEVSNVDANIYNRGSYGGWVTIVASDNNTEIFKEENVYIDAFSVHPIKFNWLPTGVNSVIKITLTNTSVGLVERKEDNNSATALGSARAREIPEIGEIIVGRVYVDESALITTDISKYADITEVSYTLDGQESMIENKTIHEDIVRASAKIKLNTEGEHNITFKVTYRTSKTETATKVKSAAFTVAPSRVQGFRVQPAEAKNLQFSLMKINDSGEFEKVQSEIIKRSTEGEYAIVLSDEVLLNLSDYYLFATSDEGSAIASMNSIMRGTTLILEGGDLPATGRMLMAQAEPDRIFTGDLSLYNTTETEFYGGNHVRFKTSNLKDSEGKIYTSVSTNFFHGDLILTGSPDTSKVFRIPVLLYNIDDFSVTLPNEEAISGQFTYSIILDQDSKAEYDGNVIAPVLSTKSERSITLVAVAGYEYSINNGNSFQSSNIFTGLSPNTSYTFVQRVKETATTFASVISAPVTITTPAQTSTGSQSYGSGGGSRTVVEQKTGETPETPTDDPGDDPVVVPEVPTVINNQILELDKSGKTGYITGYPDGTFRGGSSLTRYEAAAIFYTLVIDSAKASFSKNISKFSDVDAEQWYSEAVGYLVEKNILSGYPDGTFRGNNPITRAEFATISSKFEALNKTGVLPFSDVPSGYWAYESILSAYNNKWVSGYPDGTFVPGNSITRAEVVTIVNRMLGVSQTGAKSENTFTDLSEDEWYFNEVLIASNGFA